MQPSFLVEGCLLGLWAAQSQPVQRCPTWRFMGSYKWGYKSPNMGYTIVILLITPLTTTHEPPSMEGVDPPRSLGSRVYGRVGDV